MPIRWSEQTARKAVRTMYAQLLDRDPEPQILNGMVRYLSEGKVSIRIEFTRLVSSEEFFDKKIRDKPMNEVAEMLYQIILGRKPEIPELEAAIHFINGAGWRAQIAMMLCSEEYFGKFGDDKFAGLTESLGTLMRSSC